MNLSGIPQEQNKISDNIPDDVISKYVKSSMDLEIVKEMAIQNMDKLRQKRAQLVEEKKKLNELHQQIFSMNDEICDSVWKFSHQYDLPHIVQNYSNRPMKTQNTQLLHNYDYTELKELQQETTNVSGNFNQLTNRHIGMGVKKESTVHVRSSVPNSAIPEPSEAPGKTSSSKFVLKVPTVTSKSHAKRQKYM